MRALVVAIGAVALLGAVVTDAQADTMRVRVEVANVRSGPGVDHEVIAQLPRDRIVYSYDEVQGWSKIWIKDKRGWISTSLLDPVSKTETKTTIPSSRPSRIDPEKLTIGVVALFALAFYFLPVSVAGNRQHHNTLAIFVLNLLLGWTVVGWVGALVWACTQVKPKANQNSN